MSATDLFTRVARHDEAIRTLEKRQDGQAGEITGIRDDIQELSDRVNSRFDRQLWFIVATLAGVLVDVLLRVH